MHTLKWFGPKAILISGVFVFLTLFAFSSPQVALAATDSVVGNGTPGSCTEAALATALAAGGTVTFNCGSAPHIITFTSEKTLSVDVTVDGGGRITFSGGDNVGLFTVSGETTVILRRLTMIDAIGTVIFNGGSLLLSQVTMNNNVGGAVYSAGGTTNVVNSSFEGNSAGSGGALANENGGTLNITGSTFRSNSITGSNWGGAVFNSSSGTSTIVNSLFENNLATSGAGGAINNSNVMTIENTIIRNNEAASGGGIDNDSILTIIDTTISGNSALNVGGGGIFHLNNSTTASKLTLIRTTINDNSSQQGGGGVALIGESAVLEAVNTTISGNTANTFGGGGLYVSTGNATLTNVTFNDNAALTTAGDNVENDEDLPGSITLENTLVIAGGCAGTVVDGDGNLESPGTSCGFSNASADPGLGALAMNGGWTQTHAIAEGGPAQNAAVNANCPATDQRGVLRPQFTTCDIGAFEWGARPVLTSIAPASTVALSPTFTLLVNGSNFIPGDPGSRVLWNGTPVPTTYVDGNHLQATIDDSLIVQGGLVSIKVETDVIDGGVSQFTANLTILKRDQHITFAELEDRTPEPATLNLNATATSELPASYSATGVCSVSGSTVTLSGELGTCTITATQAGNASYNAAPEVVRSFEVIDEDEADGASLMIPLVFGKQP